MKKIATRLPLIWHRRRSTTLLHLVIRAIMTFGTKVFNLREAPFFCGFPSETRTVNLSLIIRRFSPLFPSPSGACDAGYRSGNATTRAKYDTACGEAINLKDGWIPFFICCLQFEKRYQTLETVFHQVIQHFEFHQ